MTDTTAEGPAVDKGLIFQNIDTLRAIKAAGAAGTKTELARTLARDPSSLNRTIQRLIDQGVVADFANPRVTPFGDTILAADDLAEGRAPAPTGDQLALRHDQIRPNPDNDRRDWTSEDAVADLAALAADIVQHGLLQNLVVRPDAEDGYILVGGERRWRAIGQLIERGEWDAAQTLSARLFEADDVGNRLAALAENLQRRALNPIEEAKAYQGLRDAGLSTDDIAQRVVMTPRHIQYRLALLALSEEQQRRMTLPEGDKDRISISDARKLVQEAETVRKAREKFEAAYTPRQRLIIAEMRLAAAGGYMLANVQCDGAASNADADAVTLDKAGIITLPTTINLDGQSFVSIHYSAWGQIGALLANGTEEYAATLRTELGLPQPEEGRLSIGWLNGPFDLTDQQKADLEAQKEALERQRASERAASAERDRERQAEADRRAMTRTHAEGILAQAAVRPAAPSIDGIEVVTAGIGHGLPFAVTDTASLVDAAGNKVVEMVRDRWRGASDRDLALAMMTAVAINTAAGFETPPLIVTAEPDSEDADGAEDEPEGDDQDAEAEAEPAE